MEQALRAVLMATPALSALVGARIDWGVRPQGSALPAIALHRVSAVPQMNLDAASGWSRDRVQIDCWGRTFLAAKRVADVIGGRGGLLIGFHGAVAGVRLRTFVIARPTDTDSDAIGPLHRASLDAMVWHDA